VLEKELQECDDLIQEANLGRSSCVFVCMCVNILHIPCPGKGCTIGIFCYLSPAEWSDISQAYSHFSGEPLLNSNQ